jgi:hypothetical protein
LNVVECEDELALVCNDVLVEVEQPKPYLKVHARCIIELQIATKYVLNMKFVAHMCVDVYTRQIGKLRLL